MARYLFPVDIGNRGLQHIGAPRITSVLGFNEPSTSASAISFVYDKLRRAELQAHNWVFAIKRAVLRPIDTTTMRLVPTLWSQFTTYFVGSVVVDQYGQPWISQTPDNLGFDPLLTPAWAEYFGPMSVGPWATATSYFAGELVYTAAGDGTNRTYLSLISGNTDNPATATLWDATVTYAKNAVITRSAVVYMSRIDLNLNQDPATTYFAEWAIGTTYGAAAKVTGSDGVLYTSIAGGNVGHDPTSTIGFWTNTGILSPWDTTFVSGTGAVSWRQIGGAEFPAGVTLSPLNLVYPLGAGPSSQSVTRNAFMLPASFLKKAPLDPKAGSTSYLGAVWGLNYNDWLLESGYITSSDVQPIMLRFVADTADVATFHDMFCEGLAARIGIEVCEPITQSTAKKQAVASEYQKFMGLAILANAIEAGAEEPPTDDWIACRA